MRSKDPSSLRIIDYWTFRSKKSNKRYIIEIESFSHAFLGIKFYWKGVAESKNRYSLLTNDYEPRTIIMSCIHVMLQYYFQNTHCSFGFVAAPDLDKSSIVQSGNKRFRFYKNMMLNTFGVETFMHVYDTKNSLYILINRSQYKEGNISIPLLESEISKLYEGDYRLQEQ